MATRFWLAPVGLFVLQAAPVGIEADSTGHLRLLLGASAGSYEERLVNCAGDVLDSYPVSVRTVGVEAEYWASPSVRLAAYGGVLDGSTERAPADRINPLYEGPYGGALMAYEGRAAGAGVGISVFPNAGGWMERNVVPAFYSRVGTLDGLHLRTEIAGPPGGAAAPPLLRVGLGFGQGLVRKIGGTLGFALDPVGGQDPTLTLLGSLMVPVTGALEVGGTSGLRAGNSETWHFGVQARVSLGAPPR